MVVCRVTKCSRVVKFFFACSPADTLQAGYNCQDTEQIQSVHVDTDSVALNLPPNESVDASVKPITKPIIKSTPTPKHLSAYEILYKRPSQEKSCKEKAGIAEQVYQKALSEAHKTSCQQDSDCIVVRNTTDCVMKSSCNIESYESVYKTEAKRLIGLRASLYNEVCPSCKKPTERCRKPPLTARCLQRRCKAVQARSALDLRVTIGALQPDNVEIQKTFERRAERFERCAKRYAVRDGFREGHFQYAFSLNDKGMTSQFKTLQGDGYKNLNACLVQIIKPYRYPVPVADQREFKQTLHFGPVR